MPPKPKLNVQSFPRPPLLEKTPRHLQIRYNNQLIAETTSAYWVLETYHAPTYYLPLSSLSSTFADKLRKTTQTTFCEYKGWATYYNLSLPPTSSALSRTKFPTISSPTSSTQQETTINNRIWSYESPTKEYETIKGYLAFYSGPWDCFVDGEKVIPQPGDFYGGWTTSELEGIIKGGAKTRWL